MNTHITIQKLDKEIKRLQGDVRDIKRFVSAPLKDNEGEYTQSFIEKMLARARSDGLFYRFRGRESFLKHVRSSK